jgi:chemotaxis protein CheD
MKNLVVGIGDCKVSDDPKTELVTYALGSCVGVMIHDPVAKVGGLLHFMLPESGIDREKAQQKAQQNPFKFADTGIPLLFQSAYAKGAEKSRLVVAVAGGAQMMDEAGVFNIGKRNCLAMRKIFWKAGVLVQAEHLGGMNSRTVRLEVGTGKVSLSIAGEKEQSTLAQKGVTQWRTTY